MSRAFPERSDCPEVPTIAAIEGSLTDPSQIVDAAPHPVCEFPFFDFPPSDPPLSDFGCFAIGISTTLADASTGNITGSIKYPNSSETGKCQPFFDFSFELPPCPDFAFTTSSVGVDDTLTDPSLDFRVSRRSGSACAFDIEFNLQLPPLGSTCEARAATTGDILLNGVQTIDDVALADGETVLVKDQTNAAENGVYEVKGGSWTRTCSLRGGTMVSVREGTVNGGSIWMLTTNDPISLGVTLLDFELVSGAQCCCYARAATTEDITLSGLQTIDGVSVAEGDVVLVIAQAAPEENGPYIVSDAAWTRTCEVVAGLIVSVREGNTWFKTQWILVTNDPIVLDTTELVFEIVRAPGNSTADVVTDAAITLSGLQTISGESGFDGMVVLVKDQASAATNGLYIMHSGAWTRHYDPIVTGMTVAVRKGASAATVFMLTTDGPIEVGVTALTFVPTGGGAAGIVGVDVATTGNVALSGIQAIDGVAGADGSRVLVRSQFSATDNAAYIMRSGAWEKIGGTGAKYTVYAVGDGGTVNSRTIWMMSDDWGTVVGLGAFWR